MSRRKLGLLECLKKGLAQDVRFLLEIEGNLNERDEDGRTALILCPFIEDQKWATGLARHLLEKGASLEQRDNLGRNALHYACIYERVHLTKVLLGAADYNLNRADKHGNTALFYAVLSDSSVLTELIADRLVRYKRTLNKPNKEGVTPLQLSNILKYTECKTVIQRFIKSRKEEKIDSDVFSKEGHDKWDACMYQTIDRNHSLSKSRPKSAYASCLPSRSRNEAQGAIHKRSSISRMSSSTPTGSSHHHRLSRPLTSRDRSSRSTRGAGSQYHPIAEAREAKKIIHMSTRFNPVNVSAFDMFVQNGGSTCIPNVEGLGDGQSRTTLNAGKSPRCKTWRNEIAELFVTYGQQLTSSYRPSVKELIIETPPEDIPPIALSPENDISEEMPDIRPSPSRRMSRRMSLIPSKTQIVADFPKRRASIAVPRMGRRNSTTDPAGLKPKQSPSSILSSSNENLASAKPPRRPSKENTRTGSESIAVLPSSPISKSVTSSDAKPLAGFSQAEADTSRGSQSTVLASRSETLAIPRHENVHSTQSANVLPVHVHEDDRRQAPPSRPSSRGSLHDTPSVVVTVPSDEDQIEVSAIPTISRGSIHTLSVLAETDEC